VKILKSSIIPLLDHAVRCSINPNKLKQIKIFQSLHPAYLEQVASLAHEEHYRREEFIFRYGDRGDRFFLIDEGKVRITRDLAGMGEEALAVLESGSYFGEMALVDDAPRSAHAKAHEDCVLYSINREELGELMFLNKDLAHDLLWTFIRTLTTRLREANDKMTFLTVAGKF
jgi:CRP/FNR family transcriptional regulator, cyclic AMP receptor protein